jgi:hypothetical protein
MTTPLPTSPDSTPQVAAPVGADAAAPHTPAGPAVVPVPATHMAAAAADASAASPKPTLADIDKALAANLDVMLASDAMPLEAALASGFEPPATVAPQVEHAAPEHLEQVERSPIDIEPPNPPAPAPALDATRSEPNPAPSHTAVATETPVHSAANAVEVAHETPVETTMDDPAAQQLAVAASTELEGRSSESPNDLAHDAPAAPVVVEPPVIAAASSAPKSQPLPVARSAAVAVKVAEATPAAPPRPAASAGLFTRFRQALLLPLEMMSAPLRKIPAPLRPAMDWLAISLALWAPAVWVMVFMMNASSHDAPDAADTGSPAEGAASQHASAPIHEESVVKGH